MLITIECGIVCEVINVRKLSMDIQRISNKEIPHYSIEAPAKKTGVTTTVDLANFDLRSSEQNIIQKIQLVYWAGECQFLVTLADGSTLFFDEFAHYINFWKVGDLVHIRENNDQHYVSIDRPIGPAGYNTSGKLANYRRLS